MADPGCVASMDTRGQLQADTYHGVIAGRGDDEGIYSSYVLVDSGRLPVFARLVYGVSMDSVCSQV